MRGGNMGSGFLTGIERTLRMRGTLVQRMLCAAMMAILSFARLPGGGYCCQGAMFAVLLRQGFCVPAGFAGVMLGFVAQYAAGALAGCWQLPVCTMLWLSTGLWAKPANRMTMAAAVFLIQLTAAAVTGVGNGYEIIVVLLTAVAGAGLSVLYDGAALTVSRRDELDGETRPICVLAVCGHVAVRVSRPFRGAGARPAMALYRRWSMRMSAARRRRFSARGSWAAWFPLMQGSPQTAGMLLVGGFLAGEIKTHRRWVCALLMLCGAAAGTALMRGDLGGDSGASLTRCRA